MTNAWLIFFSIGTLPVLFYTYVILRVRKAWLKQTYSENNSTELPFISIIIPFRNEKKSLPQLITRIGEQNYPKHRFEVIAIDDHSTDETHQIVLKQTEKWDNINLIFNHSTGKKEALKSGITKAKGDIITTIDADCLPTKNWLRAIAVKYTNSKSDMLIGPVKMIPEDSMFSRFQSLDFMAMQMVGAGAAISGSPVYCSGANLTFKKEAWQKAQINLSGQEYASGDDVFLLHSFKKMRLSISFIKDNNAMVSTRPEISLKGFMKQRMRWGGKSKSYSDKNTIVLALLVMFTNLYLLFSFISSIIFPPLTPFFLVPFVIKALTDFQLLRSGKDFFDISPSPLSFILYSLFYPFYLVMAAFGGLLLNISWKGRR